MVEQGDTVCETHQLLHSQMVDVVAKALEHPFYTDEVAALFDPTQFVDQIEVPVFLTGQWQDEQAVLNASSSYADSTGRTTWTR